MAERADVAVMAKRKRADSATKKTKKKIKPTSAKQKQLNKLKSKQKTSFITLGMYDKDEEELRLEERVFGGVTNVVGRLASDDDGAGAFGLESNDDDRMPERRPAWQDEDDDISAKEAFRDQGRKPSAVKMATGSFSEMLRHKFESVVGTPKWAELGKKSKGSSSDDESDEELLRHCGKFVVKKGSMLGPGTIDIKRMKDLNVQTYAEGPIIKVAQFHPSATVGLVSGSTGIASLFQVDGQSNTRLQSVEFKGFPITCGCFTRDGSRFLVGSQRHRHMYCYDLMTGRTSRIMHSAPSNVTNMKNFKMSPDGQLMAACGRFGYVYLITVSSQELVASLKMDGQVTALTFSSDGSKLFAHGDCGEVYVWDVASRSCLHRFIDDGCIEGSSLAASPSGQFLACGSRSGIVNLYETTTAMSSASPRPLKVFPNLTTAATALQFDSSSQLLAMASSDKDNAIRLAHLPSLTVYSNFPRTTAKVFRAQCLDFSLNSGFLTVGNNRGAALLFRLKSFGNY